MPGGGLLRANNEKCTDKNRLAVVLAQTDIDVLSVCDECHD